MPRRSARERRVDGQLGTLLFLIDEHPGITAYELASLLGEKGATIGHITAALNKGRRRALVEWDVEDREDRTLPIFHYRVVPDWWSKL